MSLRNKIAGDYLAIARKVHAATEQPAGFDRALEAIANRLVELLQRSYDTFQVAPEIGADGDLELVATVRRHAEAGAGLAIS